MMKRMVNITIMKFRRQIVDYNDESWWIFLMVDLYTNLVGLRWSIVVKIINKWNMVGLMITSGEYNG